MPFYRPLRSSRTVRLLGSAALAGALALTVAGCSLTSKGGSEDVTGSIGNAPAAPRSEAEWRRSLDVWGDRYKRNPADVDAAINYARALRATSQRAQAVAVLEQASMRSPNSMALSGAYGRALADAGQYAQALEALGKAHTPDNPDWRILNAQGAVLDQMGRHTDAQKHYTSALRIMPDEPSILSNLAMSYVLMKDLKRAEEALRRAVAQPTASPKVRQNLALVVGLQGRFDEAEKIAAAELPPSEAEANVGYLRQMLAQQGDWKKKGGKPAMQRPDTGT